MSGRTMQSLGVSILMFVSGVAHAQHGSGGGHSHATGGHHHSQGGAQLAAVGGGWAAYGLVWPYYVAGPGYFSPYYPVVLPMGPAGSFAPFGALPPPTPMRGPLLPPP